MVGQHPWIVTEAGTRWQLAEHLLAQEFCVIVRVMEASGARQTPCHTVESCEDSMPRFLPCTVRGKKQGLPMVKAREASDRGVDYASWKAHQVNGQDTTGVIYGKNIPRTLET